MKNLIIVVIITLWCGSGYTQESKIETPMEETYSTLMSRFGQGKDGTTGKIISTSYTSPNPLFEEWPFFVWQGTVGLFNQSNFIGEWPTFFGEFAIGIDVEVPWFYGQFTQGVAILSKTDRRLNTLHQFPTNASFGLRTDKARLGLFYKHFSNGTVNFRNRGRDFWGLEFGMRF